MGLSMKQKRKAAYLKGQATKAAKLAAKVRTLQPRHSFKFNYQSIHPCGYFEPLKMVMTHTSQEPPSRDFQRSFLTYMSSVDPKFKVYLGEDWGRIRPWWAGQSDPIALNEEEEVYQEFEDCDVIDLTI